MFSPLARGLSVSILVGFAASTARADEQSALADALFQQGKRAMDARAYGEACPKLAESQRLDPAGGTVLLLAHCHEAEGKLASAWSDYQEALGLAQRDHRDDREAKAREGVTALDPRLSSVTIVVAPAIAALPGVRVARDGTDVPAALWNTAIPIDGGDHAIVVQATGKRPKTIPFHMATERDRQSVKIEALDDDAKTAPPIASAPGPTASPPSAPPAALPSSGQRTASYVVGGVGVVGVAVGAYFGARTLHLQHEANAICPTAQCNDSGARGQASDAHTAASISNVAFGVGVIGLGLGTFLFVTSKSDGGTALRVAPMVAKDGGALGATGSF